MKPLSPDKDAAKRILEITRKRIAEALQELEKKSLDNEAVHSARKSLKRARAGLRLLRPGLKSAEYHRANASLREAARPLGILRDAKVLQDTLAHLVRRPRETKGMSAFDRLLRQHCRGLRRDVLDNKRTLAHARRLIRATLSRMSKWKPRKSNWKLLGPALERTYAKARQARNSSHASGTPEALHEWRKQVKYVRYALQILEPIWPAMVGALQKQASSLSDDLGDSHDLTALCELTLAHPDAFESAGHFEALLALSERRQQELASEVNLIGSRLFAEKPQAFASRLGGYWHEWRRDAGVS